MMRGLLAAACMLWLTCCSQALDRVEIRRSILIHRLSRSVGREDPLFSEEAAKRRYRRQTSEFFSDDEDLIDGAGSGDSLNEVEVTVSTLEPPLTPSESTIKSTDWVWYRTEINFLDSIVYTNDLGDYTTDAFHELSDKIMVAVENHIRSQLNIYNEATPLMFSKQDDDVIALIDVGMCMFQSVKDVTNAITSIVEQGHIGEFRVNAEGFSIQQIGIDSERRECVAGPSLPPTTEATPAPPSTAVSFTTEPTPPSFSDDFDNIGGFTSSTARTTTTTQPPRPVPSLCRLDQATCKNGECIDRSYLCDGQEDCLDGSDEPESCSSISTQCDPTEFLCVGTGICAQKIWRCDGDDDCGNGFDEQDCPTASPDQRCQAIQFECANRLCVPASYHCDGEQDCDDGSDEVDCSPPVVITPPQRVIEAVQGETVTIECEAVGTPTPVISWRVNWGNVPPPPRVTMTSNNGVGVLTIRKVKPSDQGAYTCEAINPNGSIFGIPDAVVTVEEGPIFDSPIMPDSPTTPEPTTALETTTDYLALPQRTDEPATQSGRCPTGEFNSSPDNEDECTSCYCFGITNQCRSSRLEYSKVNIEFITPENKQGVELEPSEVVKGEPERIQPITENQIEVKAPARELQLIDLSKRFLAAAHYWSLPAQFLGAKIKSYGGTLTFSFSYNNSYHVPSVATDHADVILEGNGKKLFYTNEGPDPEPTVKNTASVLFNEKNFKTAEGEDVTREEMLDVLSGLDRVLLRTVYDNAMISTGVGDISLEVAEPPKELTVEDIFTQPAGVIAHAVEECICPPGYEGLSCENCSAGYERALTGEDVGKCVQDSAATRTCKVGYTGVNCDECAEGYEPYFDECTRYPDTYCNVAGSIGIGIDNRCDCKTGCYGPKCDKCKPGYYFLSEENPEGCLACVCMGVSSICNSTTWNRTHVIPSFGPSNSLLFTNAAGTRTFQSYMNIESQDGGQVLTAQMSDLPDEVFYWILPEEFTGNKLSSYGGSLSYTIDYAEENGATPTVGVAKAKIYGNGNTLDYFDDIHPSPGTKTTFNIKLSEDNWRDFIGEAITREGMMMVLNNVESMMVRVTFSNKMTETKFSNIFLEAAAPLRTGQSRAFEVEQCSCPPGYSGLSCEECTQGYYRVEGGEFLGTCKACDCNGHSQNCDKTTGICRDCRHNTYGDHCEKCESGYYGNAMSRSVDACQLCPCPTIEGRNDHGYDPTCTADVDGEPVCDQCPAGTQGNRCERCAPGYIGNPLSGRACRRTDNSCNCDPYGSVDGTCDEWGQCKCKPSTTGRRCDQCKAGFFHLSVENEDGGCLPCFCMGVTQQCTSATYKRNEITSDFRQDRGGFVLTQRQRRTEITTGFELRNGGRDLTYPTLDQLPRSGPYYWQLPEEYLGDKIVSYGGKLQYKASYTTHPNILASNEPDVIIIGNDITLTATIYGTNSPSIVMDKTVVFREGLWRLSDGQPATRQHLLMVLADLEAILIKASYSTSTLSTTISRVAMETASESVLMSEPALEVEQCECPNGYEGLSCEDCAAGYTRSGSGIYLGLCHECQCHGHSDSCNSETGICEDCQDNTSGEQCEECARGYYGVATQGTSTDCKPCACPGTGDNSFSETCRIEVDTNRLVCTACEEGYTGERCERCAEGYEGNPTLHEGKCKKRATSSFDILPIVSVSPKRYNARAGSNVTLRCLVTSTLRFTVEWTRTGSNAGPLPSNAQLLDNGEVLLLPEFSRSQAGSYKCMATNRHGSSSDIAVLTLTRERPMIKVRVEEPRVVRKRVGSQVSFVCTATSKMPAYIVAWTKRGGRFPPSRSTDFDGILHITNLQVSDSGTYVCTGSNMYTFDRETAQLLVVEGDAAIPPSVMVTPRNQSVTAGEQAMFYCTVRGYPSPDIEWMRADGKPMPEDARVVGNMLMISSATMDDRALYYCRATNDAGTVEATGALEVTEQGEPPVIQVLTPEVVLTVGGTTVLKCTATGDPEPTFSWSKRGHRLPENIKVDPSSGMLRITSAVRDNQGIYTCTARNTFGQDEGYIRVRVHSKAITTTKPICRTEPKEVTAFVGTNSTITCVVGGDPLPEVTWETNDGSPLDENIQAIGEKLFIHKVLKSNAGKYVCVATNQVGVSRSKMTLHVVKKDLPKVVIEPGVYQEVNAGTHTSFACHAPDQPDADITWMRADELPFTGETSLSDENRQLNFKGVTVKEAGRYACVASNVVGHREVGVYLHVLQPPIVTVKPAKYIDLMQGESTELVCKVVGMPTPSVVWLRVIANQNGSAKMLTSYRLRSNFYSIKNADFSDAGQYLCKATNEAGNTQQKIIVTVRSRTVQKAPSVTVELPAATGTVGSQVELRCIASGTPAPSITWSKDGKELPSGSWQSEGILYIPYLSEEDQGTYLCTAANSLGEQSEPVQLSIITPPILAIKPSSQVMLVRGESAVITCISTGGSVPISFDWKQESGAMSSSVLTSGSRMQVLEFEPDRDAGRYVCTATNDAGTTKTTLVLGEIHPPVVNVTPREVTSLVGRNVEYSCSDANAEGLDVSFTWQRVDGGDLDLSRVTTENGILSIRELQLGDSGEYECVATNSAGTSSIAVTLTIHESPDIHLLLDGNKSDFVEGDRFGLRCNATGFPQPSVVMYKDGSPLSIDDSGVYNVASLTRDDTGVYSCVATNVAGVGEAQLTLTIHTIPIVTFNQSTVEIHSGEELILSCYNDRFSAATVTWTKQDGSLPESAKIEDGKMRLEGISVNDAGVYVCTLTNRAGNGSAQIRVYVHADIPYFTQTPLSYISMAVPRNAFYTAFNMTVSFRPNLLDGLLLYSYGNANDFFSLTLSAGYVEFRYDLGSGPVTIRSDSSVENGQWHTVTVSRQEREGKLYLDDNDVIIGQSPGEFRGLDLSSDLFIGGLSPSQAQSLPAALQELGTDSGFYGCISQLQIQQFQSQPVDFGSSKEVTDKVGIGRCKTCGGQNEISPCESESVCIESHHSKIGHQCNCNEGYIGARCQFKADDICNEESCGIHGICHQDLNLGLGYRCECNSGFVGTRCEMATTTTPPPVTTQPTTPIPTAGLLQLFLVSPEERPFGLGMASGGHLLTERRIPPKSSRLRSDKPYNSRTTRAARKSVTTPATVAYVPGAVSFNQESYMMSTSLNITQPRRTDVVLRVRRRSRADGLLLFNGDSSHLSSNFISLAIRNDVLEYRFNTGSGLAILQAPFFALGVGTWHTVRAIRKRNRGRLEIDGRMVAKGRSSGSDVMQLDGPLFIGGVKYWEDIPKKVNVRDGFDGCVEALRVNDVDVPFGETFSRKNTELCKVKLASMDVFSKGGQPSNRFAGNHRYSVKFLGNSYASFDRLVFSHDGAAEQISLRFRTTEPYGLILFHGESLESSLDHHSARKSGGRKDYISLGVQGAYLVYTYELGDGQGRAASDFSVSDGMWHNVTIVRRGSLALMWVDDMPIPVATQSPGAHHIANVPGLVYVGGAPDVIFATAGRYTSGFIGCVKDVRFTSILSARASELGSGYLDDSSSAALDFSPETTRERINVRKCASSNREVE